MFDFLALDIRYALRVLARRRVYSYPAVLVLMLGIASSVAVFSVVDAVVLRPLPFPNPHDLYRINVQPPIHSSNIGPMKEEYQDWVQEAADWLTVTAYVPQQMQVTGTNEPEILEGAAVASNFFEVAGIRPLLGRAFSEDEDRPGGDAVIVLEYGVWQRLFGGDAAILGRAVALESGSGDTETYTIVGIMPPGFRFPAYQGHFYIPLNRNSLTIYSVRPLRVYGRLNPTKDPQEVQAILARSVEQLGRTTPAIYAGRRVTMRALHEEVTGVTGRLPLILLGSVILLLLIAIANVANLMLAHGATRTQELVIRLSLGASPFKIARQLLTESIIVASVGGMLGILTVALLLSGIQQFLPKDVPRVDEIQINWRVLAFAAGISLFSGTLFGVYPAISIARRGVHALNDLGQALKGRRRTVGNLLTVLQISLAMVLCLTAGLMFKSFVSVLAIDTGIDPQNVVAFYIPSADFRDSPDLRVARYQNLLSSLAATPGVSHVALTTGIPLKNNSGNRAVEFLVDQHAIWPGKFYRANARTVTPQYFDLMKLQIVRGRGFEESDSAAMPLSVIVSERTAELFWRGQEPVGKTLSFRASGTAYDVPHTVIGVVRDVRNTENQRRLATTFGVDAMIYQPLRSGSTLGRQQYALVRTHLDPRPLLPGLRRAILSADPKQPIRSVELLEDIVNADVAAPRFRSFLLSSFAGIALIVASIGVYGVVSFSVATRLREIGIRLAVGAGRGQIVRLIGEEILLVVLAGVFIGTLGSTLSASWIEAFLIETDSLDTSTYIVVVTMFLFVSTAAAFIPAVRASRTNPLILFQQ